MWQNVYGTPKCTRTANNTRGDQNIRRKVPPFLYSLFKRDKILTFNRAVHMQLIDIDDAGVNRPRALQPSSRSRDIA